MREFWNVIQMAFAAVGGWLGYFLGGCDGLLYALLAFVVLDYLTGVMCAIYDHKLSSAVGFRGLCHKVLVFVMVGIGHILDIQVLGEQGYSGRRSFSFISATRGFRWWRMLLIWGYRFQRN